MYNAEYKTLVYEKGIIEKEIHLLLSLYIHGESEAPEQLMNDYLFSVDRVTPQDALQARVIKLRQEMEKIDNKLARFSFKKDSDDADAPGPGPHRQSPSRRSSPTGGAAPAR